MGVGEFGFVWSKKWARGKAKNAIGDWRRGFVARTVGLFFVQGTKARRHGGTKG
jgi:hypothetical protein